MEPEVRFALSPDGTNLAFTAFGAGVPLILCPNIWTARLIPSGETLDASRQLVAEGVQLIRYDIRGMGLSDRTVEDFGLDRQVADIEALRGELDLDQFALFGQI